MHVLLEACILRFKKVKWAVDFWKITKFSRASWDFTRISNLFWIRLPFCKVLTMPLTKLGNGQESDNFFIEDQQLFKKYLIFCMKVFFY